MRKLLFYTWLNIVPAWVAGQYTITNGEQLKYSVSYGILKAGEVVFSVDTVLHYLHEKPCRKITLVAQTKGIAGFFTKIYDKWESYIDTSDFTSVQFNRFQHENTFELTEYTEFNRTQGECYVTRKKNDKSFEIKTFAFSAGTLDAITAFFWLRNIDFDHFKKNDTVTVKVFLEDTTHKITLKNIGYKKMKTPYGKQKCVILSPQIPPQKNSFLISENPIKVWFTLDSKRIPVLIKMETKYGDVEVDLDSCTVLSTSETGFLNPDFESK